MTKATSKVKKDSSKTITQLFIDAIEGGLVDGNTWVRPWNSLLGCFKALTPDEEYQGVNALILMMNDGHAYATYKNWQALGYQVNKGSTSIVISTPRTIQDPKDPNKRIFKGFGTARVFSNNDVDGYPVPDAKVHVPHDAIDATIAKLGATINHTGDRAFYRSSTDDVTIPKAGQFRTPDNYYSVLFHELAHWTGGRKRLDRGLGNRFGSSAYAFEELVAELAATFLCSHFGINQGYMNNHVKYVASWVRILKNDTKAISDAAKYAKEAMAMILGESKAIVNPIAKAA